MAGGSGTATAPGGAPGMHRVPSRAPKAGNESAAGWRAVCFFGGNRTAPAEPGLMPSRGRSAWRRQTEPAGRCWTFLYRACCDDMLRDLPHPAWASSYRTSPSGYSQSRAGCLATHCERGRDPLALAGTPIAESEREINGFRPGVDAHILPVRRVGLSGGVARVMSGSVHSSAPAQGLCCAGPGARKISAPCLSLSQPVPAGIRCTDRAEPVGPTASPRWPAHGGTAARGVTVAPGGSSSHRSRPGAAAAGPRPGRRARGCAARGGR